MFLNLFIQMGQTFPDTDLLMRPLAPCACKKVGGQVTVALVSVPTLLAFDNCVANEWFGFDGNLFGVLVNHEMTKLVVCGTRDACGSCRSAKRLVTTQRVAKMP